LEAHLKRALGAGALLGQDALVSEGVEEGGSEQMEPEECRGTETDGMQCVHGIDWFLGEEIGCDLEFFNGAKSRRTGRSPTDVIPLVQSPARAPVIELLLPRLLRAIADDRSA
jgi:hypothetical protein